MEPDATSDPLVQLLEKKLTKRTLPFPEPVADAGPGDDGLTAEIAGQLDALHPWSSTPALNALDATLAGQGFNPTGGRL